MELGYISLGEGLYMDVVQNRRNDVVINVVSGDVDVHLIVVK